MHSETVQFRAMGSPCQLRLYVESAKDVPFFSKLAIDEVTRLEDKYSRYRSDSFLSQLNKNASQSKQLIDKETAALFDYADQAFRESGGLFDLTSGVLRGIWNFKENKIPSQSEIDSMLPFVGWQKVKWQRPYFSMSSDMEVDLGGLVKEYAADAVSKVLVESGLPAGLIELGGDIRVIENSDNKNNYSWRLGVRNPRQPEQAICHLDVSQGALATSGDYERFVMYKGRRYSHILSPLTGSPVASPAGVSVLADNCLLAGTVSTIAMLHGETGCLDWLESVGLPYCVVLSDGEVINSF